MWDKISNFGGKRSLHYIKFRDRKEQSKSHIMHNLQLNDILPRIGVGVSAPGARLNETPAYTLTPPSPDALGEGGGGMREIRRVSAPGARLNETPASSAQPRHSFPTSDTNFTQANHIPQQYGSSEFKT